MPRPRLTAANLEAFLARPWDDLGALKDEHWREAQAKDPLATFHASEALWELLHAQGLTVDPAARDADLEAHLRLRKLLDRTVDVGPR